MWMNSLVSNLIAELRARRDVMLGSMHVGQHKQIFHIIAYLKAPVG